jgi:hypothetical protein
MVDISGTTISNIVWMMTSKRQVSGQVRIRKIEDNFLKHCKISTKLYAIEIDRSEQARFEIHLSQLLAVNKVVK